MGGRIVKNAVIRWISNLWWDIWHHKLAVVLMAVGMAVMPDGPWWRELPAIMLFLWARDAWWRADA